MMIKSFKIESDLCMDQAWELYEESTFDSSMSIKDARRFVLEARLKLAYHIYTDSNGKIDILVDLDEAEAFKVTYND
jgi:hypothetical protein